MASLLWLTGDEIRVNRRWGTEGGEPNYYIIRPNLCPSTPFNCNQLVG